MSAPLIPVEEHLAGVLAAVAPLAPVRRPLADAHGCVLARDLPARLAVPPFDNSAMDGFAVRAADVGDASPDRPVRLRVVADLPAGTDARPGVGPGTAARIMTGAPLPPGADAVVPVEQTDQPAGPGAPLPGVVAVLAPAPPGRYVRRRGDDIEPGDPVLRAGTALAGRHLSAAASTGHGDLLVHPRVRVGVLATGAELVPPGAAPGPGQIPDSNTALVLGLVREAGAVPVPLGTVGDEPAALRRALAEALPAVDVVVTTGGVSAGAYDVVKEVLAPLGEVAFTAVAMQPGKPQGFGVLARPDGGPGVPIFCLPGNPVSVFVSMHVLVRPALARLRGLAAVPAAPVLPAVAAVGWRSPAGRRQYLPAVLDRELADPPVLDPPALDPPGAGAPVRVRPAAAGGSGSHLVASLARAEALAVVAADVEEVAPGDAVGVMMVGVSQPFTHLDAAGHARMVDVTAKTPTVREAVAAGEVRCSAAVMTALREGTVPKGDVLAVARVAGIAAAKKTPDLLPLAHVIGVHGVVVDLELAQDRVLITATVRTADRTGVEMEALTAVSVAALAVVDMVKGVDRAAEITRVRVVAKSGGRSGDWRRDAPPAP